MKSLKEKKQEKRDIRRRAEGSRKSLILKLKEKELKEEKRLEKERNKDLKLFLRQEQAILRKEQAERQKKISYKKLKLKSR